MRFTEFLEQIPPNVSEEIEDLFELKESNVKLSNSDIQLYCDSEKCKGVRFFQFRYSPLVSMGTSTSTDTFITYYCRNCQYNSKVYAVRLKRSSGTILNGTAMKFGELPTFGPPIPSRVISLIGPDRDIFIRGRRAENQGLGVGAFAYYRRVVENEKGRLITEVAKVAKKLGASSEVLQQFKQAAEETQFSKAVESIKTAIPNALYIDGHNPFTLLHSALSEGIHAGSDEECLEMATSIRVVLTELAERISMVLKDEAELKQAIVNLMNRSKKQSDSAS